jgi:hypothetical protein
MCVNGEIQVAVGKVVSFHDKACDIIKTECTTKANLKCLSRQVNNELLSVVA